MHVASQGHRARGAGSRRRELASRLGPLGLAKTGHSRRTAIAPVGELRDTLHDLGPVFGSFAGYLASRADLFTPQDCMALAKPGRVPDPMEPNAVREQVEAATGERLASTFSEFDMRRSCCTLEHQCHHARLRDGRHVEVRLVREDFRRQWEVDSEFFARGVASSELGAAARDFHAVVQKRLDLRTHAQALAKFEKDVRERDASRPRPVLREFTREHMLVVENCADVRSGQDWTDASDVARRISVLWLQACLEGRVFPAEPRLSNIELRPGRRVAFRAGDFGALPEDARATLWDYLTSTAIDDPENAASCLLREMVAMPHCAGEKWFAQKVRQIVPFRDGGWAGGAGQSLAEHVFLHWRLARQAGYAPKPHLVDFWRGFFLLAATAYFLSPAEDVLAGALSDERTFRLLGNVQEALDASRLGDKFDQYGMAAAQLPRHMKQVLGECDRGELSFSAHSTRPAYGGADKSGRAAALLILLALTLIWSTYLGRNGRPVQTAGAITIVSIGVVFVRLTLGSK